SRAARSSFQAWGRGGRRILDRGRAIDHQQLADMLNVGSAEFGADLFKIGDPVLTAVTINAYLDQFVSVEIDLDFLEHGLGEAVFGDRDDRIQVVGTGAQFAALDRR